MAGNAKATARLKFIEQTLLDTFRFALREAKPIAYEEWFPFPYNNFIYAVSVERSTHTPTLSNQPGTQILPSDESTLIFRLSNPVPGYNNEIRVENEVASLSLAREALHPTLSHLIPRVYGWGSAKCGQGWILQQYMHGESIMNEFPSYDAVEKANILGQMADILASFQRFKLPESIDKYGGVGFDESGRYVSTALSIFDAGPFATYEEMIHATLTSKLKSADEDLRVRGWRDNGIRARLDNFLAQGLPWLLQGMGKGEKVLVHADFTIDNIHYDKGSKKLTALFDFDFAHIGLVADEFTKSFNRGIGQVPSVRDEDVEMKKLHDAMLHGIPQPLPPNTEEVDWIAAKAWDDALRARGLQRPATIPSMSSVADAFWLSSQILPFKLTHEVVVRNSTAEQLDARKKDGEALLSGFLSDHGF